MAGVTTPARFSERLTTVDTPSPETKGRKGSDGANEDVIAIADLRPAIEIADDRFADILWERQSNLIAALAGDPQRAGFPLDIGTSKLRHIAGPKPEPHQQQDHCTIAPTPWRIAVTRTDQAIDLLCRQAPWQVRQAPMRHCRDGLIEIDLAQSVGAQISQENAQARDQFLSGAGPAPTGMFQEERADTLSHSMQPDHRRVHQSIPGHHDSTA